MGEPSVFYLIAVIAVSAVITILLRVAGFVVRSHVTDQFLLSWLARKLPAGVMVVLVVYLLRDVPISDPISALPTVIGVLVTSGVHLWRRQSLLSIGAGTITYGVLLVAVS